MVAGEGPLREKGPEWGKKSRVIRCKISSQHKNFLKSGYNFFL